VFFMLTAFEPIWILTAVGYVAHRQGLLGENATAVLSRFVFHLAMPAALFLTLARTPLSRFDGAALAAFAISTAVATGAGLYGAGRFFGRQDGERVISSMAAGYVNSANLGIPIALQLLHSVSFLVEVVLLQNMIVTPAILISLDRLADPAGRVRLRRIATLPFRNPVLLGSGLGFLASATRFHIPSVLLTSLTPLSDAAVPVALIALGASLYAPERAAAGQARQAEVAFLTGLKLVAQPLVAYLAGAFLLGLPRTELLAVVVCAGLPTAQNTFIFAQEYGVAETLASRVVVVSTLLSLGSLAAIAALLQH
jgi:malonate transporter and related proteins